MQRVWTPAYGPPGPLLKQVPAAVDGVLVLSAYGFGSPVAFIRAYLARHADAERSLLLGLWVYPPLDTADYAKLWPELRGVVARLSGVPDPTSARNRRLPRGVRAARSPACPPALRAISSCFRTTRAVRGAAAGPRGDGWRRSARSAGSCARRSPRCGSRRRRGPVRLDGNRQAVVQAKLVRLDRARSPGRPSFAPVRRSPRVDETLGGLFSAAPRPRPAPASAARHAAALGALSSGLSGRAAGSSR